MRGGIRVWKKGAGTGIQHAVAYAFDGGCDATISTLQSQSTIEAAQYAGSVVERFIVKNGVIENDFLDATRLKTWIEGKDPISHEQRGSNITHENAALFYDSTINVPKSFSLAGMLNADLANELDQLMNRVRDRAIIKWQNELNARRGAGSKIREDLAQIEVVELDHKRSRSLDPHQHRHLWLNAKVLGQDGKWSNVDSDVTMKFQPLINAEGELAARTDPAWRAALSRYGLCLDADGEITQLKNVVGVFSKRANQIEINKAKIEAEWRAKNPHHEPTPKDIERFDQLAWAMNRPEKPAEFDELEWAELVKNELAQLDPELAQRLAQFELVSQDKLGQQLSEFTIADLDRETLAREAVMWADQRSTRSAGRFNEFTLRAGVGYAVAATHISAERELLDELIEDITDRALKHSCVSLAPAQAAHIPGHIRHLQSLETFAAKHEMVDLVQELAIPGKPMHIKVIKAADERFGEEHKLDEAQVQAASIIAGSDKIVTVIGPAGAGKTTMLKVAKKVLDVQKRNMFVVAPSKKAANVAGSAIDADSSSVHALLYDHGFRWKTTPEGEEWVRLKPGQVDENGSIYKGTNTFHLKEHDRIVVDEAGMLDLHAGKALLQIVKETNTDIAFVGDPYQLSPVGHSGVMLEASRWATATAELESVHRFRTQTNKTDTEYAKLSLLMRTASTELQAVKVVDQLVERGQIIIAPNEMLAREKLVERYREITDSGKSVTITAATNEDAQHINERIQKMRLEKGEIKNESYTFARNGQIVYVGEKIQSRLNDADNDVANRDLFIIEKINDDGSVIARRTEGSKNEQITLSASYVAEQTHLAYASTAHGVQGITDDYALVAPGVNGAGLYVGATRGKYRNELFVAAGSPQKASEHLVEAIKTSTQYESAQATQQNIQTELQKSARPKPQTQTVAQMPTVGQKIASRSANSTHGIGLN